MPILYKALTAVLALTGCMSLLISGEMNLLVCAGGLAVFPGYYRLFKGRAQASKRAAAILSQTTLFVFLADAFVITGDVFLAVAHLTIIFQGIKSFDLKEPWDHLQVYFMSLLQLIIASELTRSLAFGVIFVIFMVLLVTAMVLSHFLKEGSLGRVKLRRPVIAIVALTIVCTVFFFVLLPRTPQRFIGKSHYRGIRTVGFSDRVDFGSFGDIKLDPTVVMRIEMDRDIPRPYYWRGIAMDHFDGTSWRNTTREKGRVAKSGNEFIFFPYDRQKAAQQTVFLEPLDSDVIFGLTKISAVNAEGNSLIVDDAMGISIPGKFSRRVKYTVFSDTASSYRGRSDRRYLNLPPGMTRAVKLAEEIAGLAESDGQKAAMIERYLKSNYTYSLSTTPPRADMNIIEDFLFNSRKGYCEHYASSMVIMLRGLGIPARVVNGFFGGEKNEYGNYIIVRQSDAHAWVEALVDGEWRRFDPTPPVFVQPPQAMSLFLDSIRLQWTRYVVGFSLDDQKQIVRTLASPLTFRGLPRLRPGSIVRSALVVIVTAASCYAFYLLLREVRLRRYGFVTRLYLEFRNLLRRKGLRLTDSTTSGDLRQAWKDRELAKEVDEFLTLYERLRFSGKEMDSEVRKRYAEIFKKITRSRGS